MWRVSFEAMAALDEDMKARDDAAAPAVNAPSQPTRKAPLPVQRAKGAGRFGMETPGGDA